MQSSCATPNFQFFPEVWLFDDLAIDESGSAQLTLRAPHHVAEWRFGAYFWAAPRRRVCTVPTLGVVTTRRVYVDLDMASHLYENETVEMHLTVAADQTNITQQVKMAQVGRQLCCTT